MSKTQAVPFTITDEELIKDLTREAKESIRWCYSGMENLQKEVSRRLDYLYLTNRNILKESRLTEEDIKEKDDIKNRIWPILTENIEKYLAKRGADDVVNQIKEQTAKSAITPAFTEAGFEHFRIEYQKQRALVTVRADKYKITIFLKYSNLMKGELDDIVRNFRDLTEKVIALPMTVLVDGIAYYEKDKISKI